MPDSKPKEKSARELYGENPTWGAAEFWEYRMKTVSLKWTPNLGPTVKV